MQALDTTLEKLKMLSDDNYIKAVDVINGLLSMQGTTTTSATDNITEEDNDNLDDLADDIFNKCTAAFARMA
ncbi:MULTISPECIES: hypothetical protein [Butyrivibrio]|jgi:hypothetical protein|uniref:Uncharacterized protein n=1 Tax=Butyrivibrio fibrisolvens TaxID=831 RepID=A0A317G1Q3_BUTFI|nr:MULTISPECIES: hypothetical protein [Butyrivibrio]MBQ1457423.1 hypothetical protein [Butyrivibrio sp.]PWT27417.1 hypothetical protein CPT75_10045 [Butyrivibrio fibrisolvens]SEQ43892.1 hypothetical protein SAMN02910382_03014 [Butyrivibrio sp. TB]